MELKKHLEALYFQFEDIVTESYPSFVWQQKPGPLKGNLPVFSFHSIEAHDFEEKLEFLKANRYRTVTSDEAYRYLFIDKKIPEKIVMLTFDDARKSTWVIAYPLLRKYGFKATVFMVPKLVQEDSTPSPNLEDFWDGKCDIEEISKCDLGDSPVISWREARIMQESGVIDFQSHSFDHRRIPVSSKIVGFVSPRSIDSFFFTFDIPLMKDIENDFIEFEKLLGAPIYKSVPSLREKKMFYEDTGLRDECIRFVSQNGGRAFFREKRWSAQLFDLVKEHRRYNPGNESFETDEEQYRRITESVEEARRLIEKRLPGKRIRHLAYPWGVGCSLSVECSKKVGYLSNFWSTIPHRPMNVPGGDPYYLVRIKHDLLWRLPGEGRKSLKELFLLKFLRRIRGQIDYQ